MDFLQVQNQCLLLSWHPPRTPFPPTAILSRTPPLKIPSPPSGHFIQPDIDVGIIAVEKNTGWGSFSASAPIRSSPDKPDPTTAAPLPFSTALSMRTIQELSAGSIRIPLTPLLHGHTDTHAIIHKIAWKMMIGMLRAVARAVIFEYLHLLRSGLGKTPARGIALLPSSTRISETETHDCP